jgi:hypothetical protein
MKNIFKTVAVFAILVVSLALVNAQAFAKTIGMGPGAHLTGASVTAVSGSTLSVSKGSKSYTVDTTSSTKIIRRFSAVSLLSQISVGDHINIAGTWTDTAKTVINATLIRDGSVQEKNDSFSGSVLSLTSNGFVLQSMKRGQETVVIAPTTKLVGSKKQTITQTSIVVGNKISVDGLWDNTLKTITATTIRDLSI